MIKYYVIAADREACLFVCESLGVVLLPAEGRELQSIS